MNTRAYDLVMFDLDGTLVETGPEIADATNDTLAHFGWATVSQEQVNAWIGHGTRELLLQAMAFVLQTPAEDLRHSERFAQAEAVFIGHYQSRCGTRSHLYPQVLETLSALRQQGVFTAVITNNMPISGWLFMITAITANSVNVYSPAELALRPMGTKPATVTSVPVSIGNAVEV